jgi:hypothetical protein
LRARVHAGLDDLQRHAAPDRLLLLGHEHQTHPSLADLLEQLVGADPRARALGHDQRRRRRARARLVVACGAGDRGRAQEPAGTVEGVEEVLHLGAEDRVALASGIEEGRTLGAGGTLEGLPQQALELA